MNLISIFNQTVVYAVCVVMTSTRLAMKILYLGGKKRVTKGHVSYLIVPNLLQLVDCSTLCNLLHIPSEEGVDGSKFSLCSEHYGALYRKLNPPNNHCKTCNHLLQPTKARKCPNPSLIQKFLSDNHNFVGTITDNDRVCNTCYKSHLVIIKHATNSVESKDSDLAALIFQLKSQLPDLLTLKTAEELVSYTISLISIHVGEVLLDQDAMLLPDIHEMANNKLAELANVSNIEICPSHAISKALLRNHLSAALEPHMAYRCYAKKHGTVIYRHCGDLAFTVNKLLSKSRQQKQSSYQQTLKGICEKLNTKIHHTIEKKILKSHTKLRM